MTIRMACLHTCLRAELPAALRRGSVRTLLVLILSWLALALPVPAHAALRVEAPDSASQGAAFLVRFVSDAPLSQCSIHWLGKDVPVTLLAEQATWTGTALLPMPMAQTKPLTLTAAAGGATARHTVRPLKVRWPRQELTVAPKYVSPPAEVQQRIERDRERSRNVYASITPAGYGDMAMARPVPGVITSAFGGQRVLNGKPRSQHRGVDLRGATGTPIVAVMAGQVALAEEQYYSGNMVLVNHGQGIVSMYGHMSALSVTPGQVVAAGQELGLVGATGRVTGPHLHFGVNILGEAVDPLGLLLVRAPLPSVDRVIDHK